MLSVEYQEFYVALIYDRDTVGSFGGEGKDCNQVLTYFFTTMPASPKTNYLNWMTWIQNQPF